PAPQPAASVAGSWVVTGGSGGVGRAVAAWLATHGASRIVLVARGPAEPLPALPVPVELRQADVADTGAMAAILAELPDLRGVVHAAGLLDDAPVLEQSRARFAAVMHAKVEGALVLDRLIGDRPEVRLVLFASIAGVLGSAEQSNHAAASSFLDALAHERQVRSLPTNVIDWGVWREIGAAARLGVVERAEKLGLGSIAPATGIAAFAHALGAEAPVQLTVLPGVDWRRFLGQFAPSEQPSLLQGIVTDRAEPAGATPATGTVGPTQRIARIVADVVGLPSPADPETPLPDFGLDSLMAVEIRNRIQREVAVEVGVRELLEGVTIAAIAARAGNGTPQPPSRLIEPDEAGRFAPFPLTEIQQAYWIGRGDTLELGNVGCYLYTEVELKGVDLARLERAWNMLVRRHDMLRAVVLPDGQQQILPTVPEYSIVQRDLSGDDAEDELLALRERLSHRLPDPAVWPLFDLRATHHPGGTRLHIGLDLLVLDAASIFQLREEWGRLYEDPTTALPPISLSFRDYVLEGLAWRRSEAWQRSARYWEERVVALPGGPDLPLARQPGQIGRPRFVRRLALLPADQWQQLQAAGQARGLTPSALLAAAYADVLAAWSRSARFCMTLTSFNRPPLHPDIGALIGDFTSTILLEVDTTPATFAERATALTGRLAADLDHAEVGGVHVLRELARTRGAAAASIPVVFTSALGFRAPEGTSSSWDRISDMVHSVAQTPQVWIDHQASEHAGGLLYTWDVLEVLFPAGLIETMFGAYG
ncbi:MAG: SDR family NAD(P)-dependent oxidoreductase, partial [Geminicoccaceae bacterium]